MKVTQAARTNKTIGCLPKVAEVVPARTFAHAAWELRRGLRHRKEFFFLQARWIGDPRMQSSVYSTRKPLPYQNFVF